MAVNRVDFGGNTLIDLTGDTLELPEQLLKGIIAHAKDGTPIEGTLEAGVGCRLITGTFTPESNSGSVMIDYDISSADKVPSWLIIIAEKDITTEYSSFNGIWLIRIIYSDVIQKKGYVKYSFSNITYGYNNGTKKFFTPFVSSGTMDYALKITCNPSGFNGIFLAGVTYRYYMSVG